MVSGIPRLNGGGGGRTVTGWFYDMPPVSRGLLILQLGVTLIVNFGLGKHSPDLLPFDSKAVIDRFEIWRIFSCYFYLGEFSYPMLLQLYFTAQYGQMYEVFPFNTGGGGSSADHAWFLMICAALHILVLGFVLQQKFLGLALLFSIIYVWAKRNAEDSVKIWSFSVPSMYFVFGLLALMFFLEQDPMGPISKMLVKSPSKHGLVGIAVGHFYFYIVYIHPSYSGMEFIKTPNFLMNIFGIEEPRIPGRPAASAATRTVSHRWGSGRVLGSQSRSD